MCRWKWTVHRSPSRWNAEAPLLDTSSASMGQVATADDLSCPEDGMVVIMATYAGSNLHARIAGYIRPFDTSSPSTMSIDGTRLAATSS
jgi:hypothetical protein